MERDDSSSSLAVLVLIVSLLITCFFIWLLLSSCLGASLLRPIRELWDAAVHSAHVDNTAGPRSIRSVGARRRRELGFSEVDLDLWEMESLGARRAG